MAQPPAGLDPDVFVAYAADGTIIGPDISSDAAGQALCGKIYDALAAGYQFNKAYVWHWVQDDYVFGDDAVYDDGYGDGDGGPVEVEQDHQNVPVAAAGNALSVGQSSGRAD
jgi:hypothetical protein